MTSSRPRRCVRCGARSVRNLTRPGLTNPYRMLPALPLPKDLAIPTCRRCATQYIDPQTAEALLEALNLAFAKEMRRRGREAVNQICEYISQRRLELLLGLSQGYLCRLRAGKSTPSAALVALLTLLANEPELRLRELDRSWKELLPSEHKDTERSPDRSSSKKRPALWRAIAEEDADQAAHSSDRADKSNPAAKRERRGPSADPPRAR